MKFSFPSLLLLLLALLAFCPSPLDGQREETRGFFGATFVNLIRNIVGDFSSRHPRYRAYEQYPPQTFLSTPELIRFHGYRVEEHKVVTEDGYILTVFRIPPASVASHNSTKVTKEPVLIVHGLLCSSDNFLLHPKSSNILPYLLANDGHPVWLGNIRGNTYSKSHVAGISPNSPNFFNFTADDAVLDVDAMIRYVVRVENVPKLSYIGHSMGCNLISMAVSDRPDLNDLVSRATFLAPGMFLSHVQLPLLRAFSNIPQHALTTYAERHSRGRLLPLDWSLALRKRGPATCMKPKTRHYCTSGLALTTGLNPGQISNRTLVVIMGHFPSDTSMKLFQNILQLMRSDQFHKFDYGSEKKNLEVYGQSTPPLYNVTRVTFPVQGFYALGDVLVVPQDADRSLRELGNLVGEPIVLHDKFTHLDFLHGKDAPALVYKKILQFLS